MELMANSNHNNNKTMFVTVGSTRFDQIINLVISLPFLDTLNSKGFRKLIIQYGKSVKIYHDAIHSIQSQQNNEIEIVGYDYKTSLDQDMVESDLIISHAEFPCEFKAGSGSILECLRLKKPLIVVINENLMGNHQVELAIELQNKGYLVCSFISNLLELFQSDKYFNSVSFPKSDETIFIDILNEEMGLY